MSADAASPGSGEPETTRRRLLKWFLGTSVGALIASVVYP